MEKHLSICSARIIARSEKKFNRQITEKSRFLLSRRPEKPEAFRRSRVRPEHLAHSSGSRQLAVATCPGTAPARLHAGLPCPFFALYPEIHFRPFELGDDFLLTAGVEYVQEYFIDEFFKKS